MNIKKLFHSLLVVLFCCLSLSCVLEVLPKDNKGSISFTLPKSSSEVSTRNTTTDTFFVPKTYQVIMTSVTDNKVIHDNEYKAGENVSIPDIEYGKYKIEVKGSTEALNFYGYSEVEINSPNNNNVIIHVHATKLYGSIKISINDKSQTIKDVRCRVVGKTTLEKEIKLENSVGSIEFPKVFIGDKYFVEILGDDGKYTYIGYPDVDKIVLSEDKPTIINVENFSVATGNIYLTLPNNKLINLSESILTITNNKSNEIVKTINIPKIEESATTYLVPVRLKENTYSLKIDSNNANEVYSCNLVTVEKGKDVVCELTTSPRNVYYVSSLGKVDGVGAKANPFNSIMTAIDIAPDMSQIVLLDSITEEVNVSPLTSKSLEIISANDEPIAINGNLTVNKEGSSVILNNVLINNVDIINGAVTLSNNTSVKNINVGNKGFLNLKNPGSVAGFIKLQEGTFINILVDLPISFSATVDLTNYASVKPIINVNSSNEDINPKNIVSFTLKNSINYMINSKGVVEKIKPTTGSFTIKGVDNLVLKDEVVQITIDNGVTKTSYEWKLPHTQANQLPGNLLVYVTPNSSADEKYIINKSYVTVKEGENTNIILEKKPSSKISFSNFNDSIAPDAEIKLNITNGAEVNLTYPLDKLPLEIPLKPDLYKVTISDNSSSNQHVYFDNGLQTAYVTSQIDTLVDIPLIGKRDITITTTIPRKGLLPTEQNPDGKTRFTVLQGGNEIYSKILDIATTSIDDLRFTTEPIKDVLSNKPIIIEISNGQLIQGTFILANNIYKTEYLVQNTDKVITIEKNKVDRGVLLYRTQAKGPCVTISHRPIDLINIDQEAGSPSQTPNRVLPFGMDFVDGASLENGDWWMLGKSHLGYYVHYTQTNTEENYNYDLTKEPMCKQFATPNTVAITAAPYIKGAMISHSVDFGQLFLLTQDIRKGSHLLKCAPYTLSINGTKNTKEITDIVISESDNKIYIAMMGAKTETNPTENFQIFKGTIEEQGKQVSLSELICDGNKLDNFKNAKYKVTDMQLVNGTLYALVCDISASLGAGDNSRGALIRINGNNDVTTLGLHNNKLTNSEGSAYVVSEQNQYNSFLGPRKFIAIKPDEFVIADSGVVATTSDPKNPKLKNRIVTVNINDFAKMHVNDLQFTSGGNDCPFGGKLVSGYYSFQ